MKHITSWKAILPVLFILFFSCSSNEIGNSKDVNPETIYLYYTVSYDNGDDSVSCYLQYRFAGENGTTLVLNSPAGVSIDDIDIPVDSNNISGAFYLKNFEAKSFMGKHNILYTDINGKPHKEYFNFEPVTCSTQLPAVIKRKDLSFEFTGKLNDDIAVITIEDTSTQTVDVHFTGALNKGKITVPAEELQPLMNGPLTIRISKTVTPAFQHPTKEGGIFAVMYGIKDLETSLKD